MYSREPTEPAGGASPSSMVGMAGAAAARGRRAKNHFMLGDLIDNLSVSQKVEVLIWENVLGVEAE